jgi:hypothetical protein
VPRARLRDPRLRATLATVAGLALMLVVTRLAH